MTEPLADRLLAVFGDCIAVDVLRLLLERPRTQTELTDEVGAAQPTVSRAVKTLRAVGLVTPLEGRRAQNLAIEAHPECSAVLLAVDRLAERILEREAEAQHARSRSTRRSAIRPAGGYSTGRGTEPRG